MGIWSDHQYDKFKEELGTDSEGYLLLNKEESMAKAPVKKVLTEEDIDEQTPKIVGGVKNREEIKKAEEVEPELQQEAETEPVKPVAKKKQFELGDADMSFLSHHQYSEAAWESIGRKHGVDHTTREALPGYKGRGFVAEPKRWESLPPPSGGVLTSEGYQANSSTDGFINKKPISAKNNMGGVQSELRGRKTLTVPITDEEKEETV